jgi:hypothetical protein
MGLHAVDKIEDTLQRTKDILLPFDFMTWTRLAIISVFLGGVGTTDFITNIPTPPSNTGGESFSSTGPAFSESMTGMASSMPTSTGVMIGAAIMLFSILFIIMYLNSLFKFVLFHSLREKNVRIRKNIKRHYVNGFKYFLFNIAFVALALGVIGGWIALLVTAPAIGAIMTLPAIPVGILLAIFSGIVNDFALQEMIENDKGFIASVKNSLAQVSKDWGEFGGYLLFRLIISMAVAAASFFIAIMVTLVIGLPFLIIGLAALAASPIIAGLVAVTGFLIWMVAMLYLGVPFKVFMHSYFVELYNAFMG